jgi:hypothetical protein
VQIISLKFAIKNCHLVKIVAINLFENYFILFYQVIYDWDVWQEIGDKFMRPPIGLKKLYKLIR